MDIIKEIAELKESFRNGGALTKTLVVLGGFFTLSSLASLASTIIEWKGFILNGINFYQKYFVVPAISTASIVGLEYSKTEIHAATILSICASVGSRLLAVGQIAAFREINSKFGSQISPSLGIYWTLGAATSIGIWIWYGITNLHINSWALILVPIFYPVFIVGPKLIMSRFGYEQFEKNRFNYFKAYYAYMATIFIIIGSLAAVNTGLKEKVADNFSHTRHSKISINS